MATASFKGLSASDIGDLLANTRTRNQYGPKLVEFCESDELGINPAEVWPEFKGKNASTLYQGFRNAADKAGLMDQLLIKLSDENVFIIHKERATIALAEAQDNDTDE